MNRYRLPNFFNAKLITISPTDLENGDKIILSKEVEAKVGQDCFEALIIRTLPNYSSKHTQNYSGTNPPYFHPDVMSYLVQKKIQHLLLDLPSVDREEDEGMLISHRTFWQYPENPRTCCTITELIYVPEEVKDGNYLLNLQIASFENDASPSKPVIYALI